MMKLKLGLLYETDLLTFFRVLAQQKVGAFAVNQCRLQRLTAGLSQPFNQPTLRAECDVAWITIPPPAAGRGRLVMSRCAVPILLMLAGVAGAGRGRRRWDGCSSPRSSARRSKMRAGTISAPRCWPPRSPRGLPRQERDRHRGRPAQRRREHGLGQRQAGRRRHRGWAEGAGHRRTTGRRDRARAGQGSHRCGSRSDSGPIILTGRIEEALRARQPLLRRAARAGTGPACSVHAAASDAASRPPSPTEERRERRRSSTDAGSDKAELMPPCTAAAHSTGASRSIMLLVLLGHRPWWLFIVAAAPEAGTDTEQEQQTIHGRLSIAHEALIAYAVRVQPDSSAKRPGDLPCPDLDNDGDAETTCSSPSQRHRPTAGRDAGAARSRRWPWGASVVCACPATSIAAPSTSVRPLGAPVA